MTRIQRYSEDAFKWTGSGQAPDLLRWVASKRVADLPMQSAIECVRFSCEEATIRTRDGDKRVTYADWIVFGHDGYFRVVTAQAFVDEEYFVVPEEPES